MGAEAEDHHEPNSTPKLSLWKLPYKPREPIQMLTPPLHPYVSIPFQWEEAPGKPRAIAEEEAQPPSAGATQAATKSKAARCLDLPPRLLHDDAKITITPSTTMVLDGPYVGRSLSLACTFSFRKGPDLGREAVFGQAKDSGRNFGSERWGSFKDEEMMGRGSFDFSRSLGEIFKSERNVKITRVRRRRSFFNSMNSNLLDFYASFKQVVPWRRRR
ncbi:hypothetical protein CDL12_00123 [Handroanthus impetiginosus]|uniref:Uncharacterized protein n=1 Tax=Handroanthus impetiginosus TaxID=429701 RepID=A0A2G9IBJ7_9LAMI|nr:hypothetical protein CDL12_00123 [Handroanthus impetiginosus]